LCQTHVVAHRCDVTAETVQEVVEFCVKPPIYSTIILARKIPVPPLIEESFRRIEYCSCCVFVVCEHENVQIYAETVGFQPRVCITEIRKITSRNNNLISFGSIYFTNMCLRDACF